MSSSPSPHGDRDFAVYVPRISRSLLDELAVHLRSVCETEAAVAEGAPRSLDMSSVRHSEVVRHAPSPAELAKALQTVERAASLMAEFQALARPIAEYEEIERGLHRLRDRMAQYEHCFDVVSEQLRYAKDEAEDYKQRFTASEHRLEMLMTTVLSIFGAALPGRYKGLARGGRTAT